MKTTLPTHAAQALLIGRMWQPGVGPVLVAVTPDEVLDLSKLASTCSDLLELAQVAVRVRQFIAAGQAAPVAKTPAVLANSDETTRASDAPWFLAPCDLQAVKASGVTFVASMLERVIEEQARGDASRGMGLRSNRYSMLVKDGKVVTLNVEGPGKFEVSDAETMLAQAKG
jgi:fumarylacetoacetate (FAA) hydrolase family protein